MHATKDHRIWTWYLWDDKWEKNIWLKEHLRRPQYNWYTWDGIKETFPDYDLGHEGAVLVVAGDYDFALYCLKRNMWMEKGDNRGIVCKHINRSFRWMNFRPEAFPREYIDLSFWADCFGGNQMIYEPGPVRKYTHLKFPKVNQFLDLSKI